MIATARGSMPEIVHEGTSGYLVGSVEQAVDRLGDVGTLDRAAVRASVIPYYGKDRMVDEYVALYREIFSRARG